MSYNLTMKTIFLLVMALFALCSVARPSEIPSARILRAFSFVESSHRPQVIGDKGKAWGLYQFHLNRWLEYGGAKESYGKADAKEQTRVMLNFLDYAYKVADKKNLDRIIVAATMHNNGHIVNKETDYVKKIRRAF